MGGREERGPEERRVLGGGWRPGLRPERASPAWALRPSPSVGPKLLKLQKCAGACPPTENKTKQNAAKGKANMALLKMEPGLLERLPFLLCLGLRRFFTLVLQR